MTTGASGPAGVSRHEHGSLLSVVVVPRAGRPSITQLPDGTIQVRVGAPPVDGAANTSLLKFLAGILDVPRSRIAIVSGASSRRKRIFVAGVASDDLAGRLRSALDART